MAVQTTREWQSLPHLMQEKGVGCWGYLPRSFRLLLLSKAAMVSASSANFAPCLTVVSKMGDHQRCFPMSYCRCCIASCLSCRHPWSASLGRPTCREPSTSSPYKRSLVCDPDPSSWHGLTSGVVSRKGWCKLKGWLALLKMLLLDLDDPHISSSTVIQWTIDKIDDTNISNSTMI